MKEYGKITGCNTGKVLLMNQVTTHRIKYQIAELNRENVDAESNSKQEFVA